MNTPLTVCGIILAIVFVSQALLNMTEVCPYNTFCKSGPLKKWIPDGIRRPCCENCLCTEECGLFGKCCYDFKPKKKQIYQCYTQDQLYNIPRNVKPVKATGFVTITSCSTDYKGNESCLEMRQFEDYIPVSRRSDGRIYVNRKCALCNGDDDLVEWTLHVTGCTLLNMIGNFPNIDFLHRTLLESCRLESTPPAVIYENVLKYECAGTTTVSHSCLQSQHLNATTIEAHEINCNTYNAHPYVFGSSFLEIYNNPYCLHCFENTDYIEDISRDLCMASIAISGSIILNRAKESEKTPQCGREEMFDPSQGSCLQLYCPTFYIPDFGICIEINQKLINFNYFLKIKLAFSAVIYGEIADPNKLGLAVVRFLRSYFRINIHKTKKGKRCYLHSFEMYRSKANASSIEVVFSVLPTEHCSVYYIIRDANGFKQSIALPVTVVTFPTLNISLANITFLQSVNETDKELLYNTYTGNIVGLHKSVFVSSDMLDECPCLEIDISRHPLQKAIVNYAIDSYIKGNETTVKICVEDYMALINTSCQRSISTPVFFLSFGFAYLLPFISTNSQLALARIYTSDFGI